MGVDTVLVDVWSSAAIGDLYSAVLCCVALPVWLLSCSVAPVLPCSASGTVAVVLVHCSYWLMHCGYHAAVPISGLVGGS